MTLNSYHTIKGYELRERAGVGGSGAVYRAYQASIGREVAIKVILPEYANQPEFIRRFEAEAQLIARLEHPHIVPLFDYWRDPDGAYLVMRWLSSNLRTSLQHGAWTAESAAKLLEQIAEALTVAHREGIIHRDIKPDNILLDEDNNAYLADFGIAKNINISSKERGVTVGSPAYITPEQIRGEAVSAHTDIYSLGLVIYELLTAEQAYSDATTPEELHQRHLNTPLPLLAARRSNLPAALDEVLQTATAKNPEHRYATALRFAAAFRASLPNLQRTSAQPLADPLTDRELVILRLMVEGLSNREIAQKLFIASGTVKWYVTSQIYSKLDVHSRNQAIDRAHQLHLVGDKSTASPLHETVPDIPRDAAVISPVRPVSELVNPYKGLRAFQEADAADFFGRASLTERLLARLSGSGDGSRFLGVIGPSGSGKSSLVRAALIPALRQGGLTHSARWFITEMLPGTHPLEELEAALLRVSINPLPSLLEQLAEDRRGLVRAAKRILPADQEVELVLVIDQFEELFTLAEDEKVRTHLIDNLLSAVSDPRGRVRIVLTLRADFYDRPLLYPRLAELIRSYSEAIVPMTASELERAIAGPAERVGLKPENGLVTTLVHDVGEQPGALPLLQYALSELYERRVESQLTLDAYHEAGGLSGALARRADTLYEALDESGKAAAKQLFLRLITLGEGAEDTRRRTLQAELSSLLDENRTLDDVIDVYGQYRLLTFDRDPLTRGPTIEIAHEALIREWGRLREWLRESREALRVQRRLMAFCEEWLASGRDASYLASGARLMQFEALAEDGELRLNHREREYLAASVTVREQQARAEQERQARELSLARQAANRLRSFVGALVIFLVIAASLSIFALNSRSDALNNFTRAEAQRLAEESNRLRDQHLNSIVASLLAIRSMNLQHTPPGDEALTNAAMLDLPMRRFDFSSDPNFSPMQIAYSPDGRTLLVGSVAGSAHLFDLQTGQDVHQFSADYEQFSAIAYAPDGKTVAVDDGKVVGLWDAQTGAQLRQLVHPDFVNGIVFSPDGRYLLTGSNDDMARLWDVATGQEVQRYSGDTDRIGRALAFFPDGRHIITGSQDRTVRIWETLTGKEVQRITVGNIIDSVSLSPDAKTILVSGGGAMLQLWDWQTGKLIQNFPGDSNEVVVSGFLPDSHTIFSAGIDYTIRLWDVGTGTLLRQLVGHTKAIYSVAVSPDSRSLASGSADDTVLIWNLAGSGAPPTFVSPGGAINFSVAVSPNGQYVLTGGVDHIARLWDANTGRLLHELIGHTDNIFWVTFSPDSRYALTTGQTDGSARLWDVETGQQVREFDQGTFAARAIFSPNGKLIMTNSFDNIAYVWDAQTGQKLATYARDTIGPSLADSAFSPDSRWIAAASEDGTVRLFNATTGQEIQRFDVPGQPYALVYAPDSKTFFVGGVDGIIRQWDIQSNRQLQQIVAHTDPVSNLAISPDGRFLASAGDVTGKLWDTQTGQLLRTFVGSPAEVGSVTFFPDGKRVLTGDQSGIARVWDVDFHDTIRDLCARLLRDFTDSERAQYEISDYDHTCPPSLQTTRTVVSPTWMPVPTHTIPVWTPLPLTPLPSDMPSAGSTAPS